MSADNWATCPKCLAMHVLEKETLDAGVELEYGKVPAEEYLALLDRQRKWKPRIEATLREDFEFYLSKEGSFEADYKGSCTECSFSFKFSHREQIQF